jgi:hypothetical protein
MATAAIAAALHVITATLARAIVACMSSEAVVRSAIEAQRALFLVYRGGATRVVHPHALYRTAAGRVLLDGYQVAGDSSSGDLPGWREFDLALTTDVEPLGDGFDIAPGFDPDALKYRRGALAIVGGAPPRGRRNMPR